MQRNIALAEELGATVVRVRADRPADGLIAFAKREGITHVIFGQSARTRWEILLKGSTLNRFLEEVRDAAVQVVPLGAGRDPAQADGGESGPEFGVSSFFSACSAGEALIRRAWSTGQPRRPPCWSRPRLLGLLVGGEQCPIGGDGFGVRVAFMLGARGLAFRGAFTERLMKACSRCAGGHWVVVHLVAVEAESGVRQLHGVEVLEMLAMAGSG